MKNWRFQKRSNITLVMSFMAVMLLAVTAFMIAPALMGAGFIGAAIFTPSPAMGEIRGKAGSDVWSKNHYGGFFRKLVKPINPKSIAQMFVRNSLKNLSKGFKALTQEQIAAWNSLGKEMKLTNSLGQKSTMTGENAYISCNQNLLMAAVPAISDAPGIIANAVAGLLTFSATAVHAGAITLTYTNAIPAGQHLLVYSSGSMSAGKTYNSVKKFVAAYVAADASPLEITTQYDLVFGSPAAAGEKIYFYAKLVDDATGFVSAESAVSCITT